MNKTGILVVLSFIVIIAIMSSLTSCCMNVCEKSAPELHPMPDDGIYMIDDVIEIPVTPNGK